MIAALGCVAVLASACGRRGSLEGPPGLGVAPAQSAGAQAPAGPRALPQTVGIGSGSAAPDPDAVRDGDELDVRAVAGGGTEVPVKTSRGAKRGYVIPKQPFILDPLL